MSLNLRKLLVCLICNFCIFNNCSLGSKICYCVSTTITYFRTQRTVVENTKVVNVQHVI